MLTLSSEVKQLAVKKRIFTKVSCKKENILILFQREKNLRINTQVLIKKKKILTIKCFQELFPGNLKVLHCPFYHNIVEVLLSLFFKFCVYSQYVMSGVGF